MLDFKESVLSAEKRIRRYLRETPLDFSLPLSKAAHSNLYLKCENLQYTGAFKLRGAFNKILSVTPSERKNGFVTASTGNHGTAVAFVLNQLKIPGVIFVPEHASSAKVANIQNYDLQLKFFANDSLETELHAIEYAKQHGMIYVSPYNDFQVIAGQGTIGLEITRQLASIDAILVPVGGGGLISGIAGYVKSVFPSTKIIACLPENSPVMAESIKADHVIAMKTLPTLSDATAGGIEEDSITFDLCRQFVDDYILVSEQEIKEAILSLINAHHLLVEGASGVALGAFFKNSEKFYGKNVVVVLSGGNISLDDLRTIISICD